MHASGLSLTAPKIADWERQVLAGIDLGNLTDLMKLARVLDMAAAAFLDPPLRDDHPPAPDQDVSWDNSIHALRARADRSRPDEMPLLASLIRMYSILAQAMRGTQAEPADAEIVWRYVTGDIAASTACLLSGWGEVELARQCLFHGFEPHSAG